MENLCQGQRLESQVIYSNMLKACIYTYYKIPLTNKYRKYSCISRTPNFQAKFREKNKKSKKHSCHWKKVGRLFTDFNNKLCCCSDINKLLKNARFD